MNFPTLTSYTAGLVLVLQMLLMFSIMRLRMMGQQNSQDGPATIQRFGRRHGNLAENAAIFLVAFGLLELGGFSKVGVFALCVSFIVVRLLHAIGMSTVNIDNPMRGIGALGTLLLGLVTGAILILRASGAV